MSIKIFYEDFNIYLIIKIFAYFFTINHIFIRDQVFAVGMLKLFIVVHGFRAKRFRGSREMVETVKR